MRCAYLEPSPGLNRPINTLRAGSQYAGNSYPANRIREILVLAVKKSKRKGYWFRLGRTDRSFLSLALRVRVRFESPVLLKAIVGTLKRLKELGDAGYRAVKRGATLAWAFSEAAVRWGHPAAKEWRNDRNYILFLGKINASYFATQ